MYTEEQTQPQRAGRHSQCSRATGWLSGADPGAEGFKDLATAVSPCLLLKRHSKEEYFLLIYTVENEDVREKKEWENMKQDWPNVNVPLG